MAGIELNEPGKARLLMGNEAIARGALEAGIGFTSAYPGTPATEIMESLAPVASQMGFYAEWSVNEMVAMEAAFGASMAGIRSLASMKQNGLFVILDFLNGIILTGTGDAGIVLAVADDPSAISSSHEGESRVVARDMYIPVVEPGTFQEAKEMTKWLFELSEELKLVCMIRSVTRMTHGRGNVVLGELPKTEHRARFEQTRDTFNPQISRFVGRPKGALRPNLQKKIDRAREIFNSSPFNWYEGPDKADLMVVTTGSGWYFTREAVKMLGLSEKVGIIKLGTVWPLPDTFLIKHLSNTSKVLFVEEPDPFLEESILELINHTLPEGKRPACYGKHTGHIDLYGDQTTDIIIKGITSVLEIEYQPQGAEYLAKVETSKSLVPDRGLTQCPGCPHRASYWAIKTALKLDGGDGFLLGDVGCYTMGYGPSGFYQSRASFCMGSGTGMATGLGKLGQFGFDQPVLAACGDSTFFHAAMPALVNGVFNKSKFTMVLLDNTATAMTGFQPHPGTGKTAMGESTEPVNVETFCRSMRVPVAVTDPFDLADAATTLMETMRADVDGPRVVIMRRECQLIRGRREKAPFKMHLDPEKCVGESCGCDRLCTRVFRCPGLIWDKEIGKSRIDEVICTGCGVCAEICPQSAIVKEAL